MAENMPQLKAKSTTITVVINTKNEEKNIAACIRSARLLSQDILVVDMQSSDSTAEMAEALGVSVLTVKDYGYVEPARTIGLAKAKGEWIFVLDADERVTPVLAKELKKIILKPTHDIYAIPRKNIILKKWIKHTGWWPDHQTRFFKKGKLSWGRTIHALPKMQGSKVDLPARESLALVHYNLDSVAAMLERISRYAQHEPAERSTGIQTVLDLAQTLDTDLRWRYLEKEGYKDGLHGYVLSECMRFYRLLMFMNQWEQDGYPNIPGSRVCARKLELAGGLSASLPNEKNEQDDIIIRAYKQARYWVRNFRK